MLIIKLTRTQLLQQQSKRKEEKAADKKKRNSTSQKLKSQNKPIPKTIVCSNNNAGTPKISKSIKKQVTLPLKRATKPKAKPANKTIDKKRLLKNRNKVKVTSCKNNVKPKTKTVSKVVAKKKPMNTKKTSKASRGSTKVVSRVGSKPTMKVDTQQAKEEEAGRVGGAGPVPDCRCREGGREQSCWMCRLAQRLGGKNIASAGN